MTMTIYRVNEIIKERGLKKHHTSTARGYVSRKGEQVKVEEYNGKFGKGIVVKKPRFDTSQYVYATYWVE